jgi:hypothetical protein
MEVMKEIESAFATSHPGVKVICAGDHEIPDDVKKAMDALQAKMDRSFFEGRCIDCDAQMPNWPPPEDDAEFEKWNIATGWKHFKDLTNGDITGFQCPACDAKES